MQLQAETAERMMAAAAGELLSCEEAEMNTPQLVVAQLHIFQLLVPPKLVVAVRSCLTSRCFLVQVEPGQCAYEEHPSSRYDCLYVGTGIFYGWVCA